MPRLPDYTRKRTGNFADIFFDRAKAMTQRIDYKKTAPGAFAAMLDLEAYLRSSGLEHSLLELVKIRVSQINGCAYCLDMHHRQARADGESQQRLDVLPAWAETTLFSDRERAALALAEAVTRLPAGHVPDEIFAPARRHFDDKALVDLTLAIIAINGWNRLAITFRVPPENHESPVARTA